MRQAYINTFKDLDNLSQHKDIFNLPPQSAQQTFLQTIAGISLCSNKQAVGELFGLLNSYRGAFSNLVFSLKYCTYCMQKDKSKNYQYFTMLKMLARWVETLQAAKKKKDVRLYETVVEGLQLGISSYEQFIVYLNYISFDLTALIKSGTQQSKKKYPDLAQYPYLDSHDLIKFLNIILPKVLINIMVPRNFFPPTLLKSNQQNVDLLYSNQNIQNIAQNKVHYNTLVRTLLKTLLGMELEPSQIKQLILCSFKYYYIFHHDKNCSASQYVIESLKKMTSAVRYAISDQISLFVTVLKKLGKQLFISYLSQKFSWFPETTKTAPTIGLNKSTLKPYNNEAIQNSLKIPVAAGKTQNYYIEVYDRFSLVYFSINCMELDINLRFYYLGKFGLEEGLDDRKLLFFHDKRQGIFQGSVQAIEQGIYMFQFDNSYSWMKAKTLTIDVTVLVPIQLREQSKNRLKPFIYQRYQNLNQIPFQNIAGWVDQNQIKVNSTSANITCLTQSNIKTYNLKLIKNTGQAYQYQTDLKSRFLKKLRNLEKDPNLFWLIQGYKVKGIVQIQKWLDGEYEPDKLETLQEMRDRSKKLEEFGMEEERMLEEDISEEQNSKKQQTVVTKQSKQDKKIEKQKPKQQKNNQEKSKQPKQPKQTKQPKQQKKQPQLQPQKNNQVQSNKTTQNTSENNQKKQQETTKKENQKQNQEEKKVESSVKQQKAQQKEQKQKQVQGQGQKNQTKQKQKQVKEEKQEKQAKQSEQKNQEK